MIAKTFDKNRKKESERAQFKHRSVDSNEVRDMFRTISLKKFKAKEHISSLNDLMFYLGKTKPKNQM